MYGQNRNLSPVQFLHGSAHKFEVGDEIHPTGKDGRAYFTHDEYEANVWGRRKSFQSHVYPVEPQGDYHDDPYSIRGFRSDAPLKVVGPGKPTPNTLEMRAMAKTHRPREAPHTEQYKGVEEKFRYANYDDDW